MKKVISTLLAGAISLTALMGLVACTESEPPEEPDVLAPAFSSADATVSLKGSVDKTSQNNRISKDLFGLFLEDINYAVYALDDNLVADSSFDANPIGTDWKREDYWVSQNLAVTYKSDEAGRVYSTNETYAEIATTANGTLTNKGFDAVPMAVKEGTDYVFSAFVKNAGSAVDMTVEVVDAVHTYLSEKITLAQNANWVKYQRTIKASGTAASGLKLRLTFGGTGTVCLDSVTLETTDSTVGIKNYLYKALEDLSPAFFRFPGGCIIEGSSMNTAYDWKNSIGAVKENGDDKVNAFTYTLDDGTTPHEVSTFGEYATRTPNTNLWAYNGNDAKKCFYEMDYSIGFYEYFMLCEALGASAVPILNCGMSCQIQRGDSGRTGVALAGRHSGGVQDYIQDALDLVAFAKGDVNSSDANEKYWANVRKNMGHPEPFEMTYLGIGNEQWSAAYYNTYYEKFLEAFQTASESNKSLYGSVKLIVGNGPLFGQCENTEKNTAGEAKTAALNYQKRGKIVALSDYGVVDHHYYMGYVDFFQNTHFYDNYSRDELTRYDIFVGEYSANNNDAIAGMFQHTNNSWITALSEAAFMTGLERNGDIVKLAAYAPMYGKYQTRYTFPDNNWYADMMFYTNTELMLTPNYYVQQIFMKNAGDYKIQSEVTFASGEAPTLIYTGQQNAKALVDSVYYVTSMDEETGDVIVKIVNSSPEAMKFNVDFAIEGLKMGTIAEVTTLSCELPFSTSTVEESAVYPESYKIGGFTEGKTFGYEAPGYSVTAIRIRTK